MLLPFYNGVGLQVLSTLCSARPLQYNNTAAWQTYLRYHKLRKTFSKLYRRYYALISKYNVGLKTLLGEGLSDPEFYGDLVYKFKKLIGRNDFSFSVQKNHNTLQTYRL